MPEQIDENNVKVSKRICAYLLDVFFVFILVSLISSIRFINPTYDKYVKTYEEYNNLVEKYTNNEIDEFELLDHYQDSFYYLTKYSVVYNVVIVVALIGYFVFFQKYNNGQTLGKKIMKIKVVNEDNNNPSLGNYFIRMLPIHYVYVGSLIPLILNSILVFILNKKLYMIISSIITIILFIISTTVLISIVVRKDKRGFHDILAKTKVVYE